MEFKGESDTIVTTDADLNSMCFNVTKLFRELKGLLDVCNKEAQYSIDFVDQIKQYSSLMVIGLSDLEKEMRKDSNGYKNCITQSSEQISTLASSNNKEQVENPHIDNVHEGGSQVVTKPSSPIEDFNFKNCTADPIYSLKNTNSVGSWKIKGCNNLENNLIENSLLVDEENNAKLQDRKVDIEIDENSCNFSLRYSKVLSDIISMKNDSNNELNHPTGSNTKQLKSFDNLAQHKMTNTIKPEQCVSVNKQIPEQQHYNESKSQNTAPCDLKINPSKLLDYLSEKRVVPNTSKQCSLLNRQHIEQHLHGSVSNAPYNPCIYLAQSQCSVDAPYNDCYLNSNTLPNKNNSGLLCSKNEGKCKLFNQTNNNQSQHSLNRYFREIKQNMFIKKRQYCPEKSKSQLSKINYENVSNNCHPENIQVLETVNSDCLIIKFNCKCDDSKSLYKVIKLKHNNNCSPTNSVDNNINEIKINYTDDKQKITRRLNRERNIEFHNSCFEYNRFTDNIFESKKKVQAYNKSSKNLNKNTQNDAEPFGNSKNVNKFPQKESYWIKDCTQNIRRRIQNAEKMMKNGSCKQVKIQNINKGGQKTFAPTIPTIDNDSSECSVAIMGPRKITQNLVCSSSNKKILLNMSKSSDSLYENTNVTSKPLANVKKPYTNKKKFNNNGNQIPSGYAPNQFCEYIKKNLCPLHKRRLEECASLLWVQKGCECTPDMEMHSSAVEKINYGKTKDPFKPNKLSKESLENIPTLDNYQSVQEMIDPEEIALDFADNSNAMNSSDYKSKMSRDIQQAASNQNLNGPNNDFQNNNLPSGNYSRMVQLDSNQDQQTVKQPNLSQQQLKDPPKNSLQVIHPYNSQNGQAARYQFIKDNQKIKVPCDFYQQEIKPYNVNSSQLASDQNYENLCYCDDTQQINFSKASSQQKGQFNYVQSQQPANKQNPKKQKLKVPPENSQQMACPYYGKNEQAARYQMLRVTEKINVPYENSQQMMQPYDVNNSREATSQNYENQCHCYETRPINLAYGSSQQMLTPFASNQVIIDPYDSTVTCLCTDDFNQTEARQVSSVTKYQNKSKTPQLEVWDSANDLKLNTIKDTDIFEKVQDNETDLDESSYTLTVSSLEKTTAESSPETVEPSDISPVKTVQVKTSPKSSQKYDQTQLDQKHMEASTKKQAILKKKKEFSKKTQETLPEEQGEAPKKQETPQKVEKNYSKKQIALAKSQGIPSKEQEISKEKQESPSKKQGVYPKPTKKQKIIEWSELNEDTPKDNNRPKHATLKEGNKIWDSLKSDNEPTIGNKEWTQLRPGGPNIKVEWTTLKKEADGGEESTWIKPDDHFKRRPTGVFLSSTAKQFQQLSSGDENEEWATLKSDDVVHEHFKRRPTGVFLSSTIKQPTENVKVKQDNFLKSTENSTDLQWTKLKSDEVEVHLKRKPTGVFLPSTVKELRALSEKNFKETQSNGKRNRSKESDKLKSDDDRVQFEQESTRVSFPSAVNEMNQLSQKNINVEYTSLKQTEEDSTEHFKRRPTGVFLPTTKQSLTSNKDDSEGRSSSKKPSKLNVYYFQPSTNSLKKELTILSSEYLHISKLIHLVQTSAKSLNLFESNKFSSQAGSSKISSPTKSDSTVKKKGRQKSLGRALIAKQSRTAIKSNIKPLLKQGNNQIYKIKSSDESVLKNNKKGLSMESLFMYSTKLAKKKKIKYHEQKEVRYKKMEFQINISNKILPRDKIYKSKNFIYNLPTTSNSKKEQPIFESQNEQKLNFACSNSLSFDFPFNLSNKISPNNIHTEKDKKNQTNNVDCFNINFDSKKVNSISKIVIKSNKDLILANDYQNNSQQQQSPYLASTDEEGFILDENICLDNMTNNSKHQNNNILVNPLREYPEISNSEKRQIAVNNNDNYKEKENLQQVQSYFIIQLDDMEKLVDTNKLKAFETSNTKNINTQLGNTNTG